jgi:hypothetical protein
MNVVAISTPRRTGWQWRIVSYAGETVEESSRTFPTIASAVADGSARLRAMDVVDVSERPSAYGRSIMRPARNRPAPPL